MSDISSPDVSSQKTAQQRLDELKRALQRQLNRKPTAIEKTAMERAALMTLRAEMAAGDPKSDSAVICRLDNCARRARQDFERLAGIDSTKAKAGRRSMADIEAELRAHG